MEPNENYRNEMFVKELENLLNRYSIDTYTHTPDFILSDMIFQYLKNYKENVEKLAEWRNGSRS